MWVNERNGFKLPDKTMRPVFMRLTGFVSYQILSNAAIATSFYYLPISKSLQTISEPYASADVTVSVKLLKSKQLSAELKIMDVFNSTKTKYTMYYDNNMVVNETIEPT